MTQTNCFTILSFYFIIGLDSNKGVERTLPIWVPRTEGSAGLNLSRLYSIYNNATGVPGRYYLTEEMRIVFLKVNFSRRLGRIRFYIKQMCLYLTEYNAKFSDVLE